MKLKRVRVQNFRSVIDSGVFSVDQVTCLVGKNESGKSAVLDAVYKLNPVESEEKLDELDLPRSMYSEIIAEPNWRQQHCVTTLWQLEENDRSSAIETLGLDPFDEADVSITLSFDNAVRIGHNMAESRVVQKLITRANLDEAERTPIDACDTIKEAAEAISSLESISPRQQAFLSELEAICPDGNTELFYAFLETRLPRFIKFSEYYLLPGRVALSLVLSRLEQKGTTREDRVFLALLHLAGRSLENMTVFADSEHHIAALEATSNRLTDEISKYWTTNQHLSVQFRSEPGRPTDAAPFNSGYVFETRIHNARHRVTLNFDERSTGFVWFFSFLIWFSHLRGEYGDNLIILLDEPGLHLHGKAQADLLCYINERLRPYHQIIYTTHSPYMIDPNAIASVRTVEDRSQVGNVSGTKVREHPSLESDEDTVLPIMGALGSHISRTLFGGGNPLLVSTVSDMLILCWFSRELKARERIGLDDGWTVTPAGDLTKLPTLASLAPTWGRKAAIIAGMPLRPSNETERMLQTAILKRAGVLFLNDYVAQMEADFEDLIGRRMYNALLADTYRLRKRDQLPENKPDDSPPRLVQEADDRFRRLNGFGRFDRLGPARYLTATSRHVIARYPGFSDALERFERLFKDLNALLAS
jgi:AAA domain, putative AbiEii toxin, Type IV TA system